MSAEDLRHVVVLEITMAVNSYIINLCGLQGETKNAYKIVVGKSIEKRQHEYTDLEMMVLHSHCWLQHSGIIVMGHVLADDEDVCRFP